MSKLLGKDAYKAICKQVGERTKPFKEVVFKMFKDKEKLRKKKEQIYKHKFSLRIGEIIHVNGIPCEYLGLGAFGSNTYPGKPSSIKKGTENETSYSWITIWWKWCRN